MSEDRTAPAEGGDTDLDTLDDILGLEPDGQDAQLDDAEQQSPVGGEPLTRENRENQRLRSLRARLKEQEDENRKLRDAVLASTQRQPAYQPAAPPDPYRQAQIDQQEAERVAMMQPHEVAAYYANKAEQRMSSQLMQARLEAADVIDRQGFDRLRDTNLLAEKYASQVNEYLTLARQQGSNPTRESILKQLIGEEVLSKGNKREIERQRRQGRQAIARETTQPGSSRSNVTPTQRRNGANDESLEATIQRLKGVTVGEL